MSEFTPLALSCALVCVWPAALGVFGYLLGRRVERSGGVLPRVRLDWTAGPRQARRPSAERFSVKGR
jgi:hypothetical protein